jgi:hypothetical protein
VEEQRYYDDGDDAGDAYFRASAAACARRAACRDRALRLARSYYSDIAAPDCNSAGMFRTGKRKGTARRRAPGVPSRVQEALGPAKLPVVCRRSAYRRYRERVAARQFRSDRRRRHRVIRCCRTDNVVLRVNEHVAALHHLFWPRVRSGSKAADLFIGRLSAISLLTRSISSF